MTEPSPEEIEEFKRIQNLIKSLEEKSKEDISFLLENSRHDNEDNEQYSIRKKLRAQFKKQIKKGYLFHRSKYLEPVKVEDLEKPVYQTRTSTYKNSDKKSKFKKKKQINEQTN